MEICFYTNSYAISFEDWLPPSIIQSCLLVQLPWGKLFLTLFRTVSRTASWYKGIPASSQPSWTKRLSVTEREYVEFLKEHKEAYEDSVEMEEYLEDLKQQWEHSHTGMLFAGIQKEKEMQKIAEYQNKLKLLLRTMVLMIIQS